MLPLNLLVSTDSFPQVNRPLWCWMALNHSKVTQQLEWQTTKEGQSEKNVDPVFIF